MIRYYLKNTDWELRLGTEGAAGYDVRADLASPRTLEAGQRWKVPTGLFVSFPRGVVMEICSRSGLAIHHAIVVGNAPGIVDSDYRGEVFINLVNADRQDHHPYTINPGDRIAQVLFKPTMQLFANYMHRDSVMSPHYWQPQRVATLEELGSTERGSDGHGSTGR